MPRGARVKSESGIYHIMLRGINRENIFYDDEDYEKFIDTLKRYKDVSDYKIYAYCLMTNHIHILLKVGKEDIDLVLKRIAGSFVYWYNWKYHRVGHLFQDRFKSEPIDDDIYFLTVLRYIHQNPVKAYMVKDIDDYLYSSIHEYINENSYLTNTEFALSLMDIQTFIQFNRETNDDECLEDNDAIRLNDIEAKKIIFNISKCKSIEQFQELPQDKKDKYIEKLKKSGLSIRQICRLTGEKFSKVRK